MEKSIETSKQLLNTLASHTNQAGRQEIFSGLFSPEVDYMRRAFEVLSSPEAVEEINNIDEGGNAFLYSRRDQVSVYPEGIFFIGEEGSRELILSFRHRIYLLGLAHLFTDHFSDNK
ncbi:hypothetical protein KA050_03775 [Candidatus Gracilibacteria bacterium]|nr:hypothetical protein [Candidatus Gracilibacteria bacterium]